MMNPVRAFPINGLQSPTKYTQDNYGINQQKRNQQHSREQSDPMRRSKSSGIFKSNQIDPFTLKPKVTSNPILQDNIQFQTPTNHQRTKSHNIVQSTGLQRDKDQLNSRKIITNDDSLFKEQFLSNTPQINSTKSQPNIYKQPLQNHQKGLFSTKNQNMQNIFGSDKQSDTSGQKLPRIDSGRSNNSNVKRRLNDELGSNNNNQNGVGNSQEKAVLGDLKPTKINNNQRLSIVAGQGQNILNQISSSYNFKAQQQDSRNDQSSKNEQQQLGSILNNNNNNNQQQQQQQSYNSGNKIFSQKNLIGGNTRQMFGQPVYRSNGGQDINKLMNQIGNMRNGNEPIRAPSSGKTNISIHNKQQQQGSDSVLLQQSNQKNSDVSTDKIQNISISKQQIVQAEKYLNQITNFAVKTKAGSLPGMPVKKNQDSSITLQNYMKKPNKFFFGICDGHGVNGHLASQFIKKTLPINIDNYIKGPGIEADFSLLKQQISKAFLKTNADLIDSGIDVTFSGSTTVVVYINGQSIYCANIGDSRAIIAKQKESENGRWQVQPLSIDQKPDLDLEMKRIIAKGGRVEPFKDLEGKPLGPSRVWLKNENVPGLAMARSFGDYIAQQVGVISDPEIITQEIDDEDKFIVLASDGIWEFLSNEYVMNSIIPYYHKNDPSGACDKLIRDATNAWKKEDEVVDDITIIIVFLSKKKVEQ